MEPKQDKKEDGVFIEPIFCYLKTIALNVADAGSRFSSPALFARTVTVFDAET